MLYNVGSFSRGGNIMENKLQAKGLGLNGKVLLDEELGTIGEDRIKKYYFDIED